MVALCAVWQKAPRGLAEGPDKCASWSAKEDRQYTDLDFCWSAEAEDEEEEKEEEEAEEQTKDHERWRWRRWTQAAAGLHH
mmetsp:Transcript_9229/g.25931  ORF Transcript_9229/g.25931 Transcript_9229/m.25931 type:complete len:81 (-) Transcript_9229:1016-1258(-)